MSKAHLLQTNGYALLEGANTIVTFGLSADMPLASSTSPSKDNTVEVKVSKNRKYVQWGNDNKLPFAIKDDVGKATVLSAGLRQRVKVHFGKGIIAYTEKVVDGKRKQVLVEDENIQRFFRENKINAFALAQITDYEWYGLTFPELILDNAGKNIVAVSSKSAPYCRFEEQKLINGRFMSEKILYSKVWHKKTPDKSTSVEIDHLPTDLTISEAKEYVASRKIKKFIRPIVTYVPATDYYPHYSWHSARESGWLDIAKLIPKVKAAIIKNSMTLKYIVKIPLDYFSKKYPTERYSEKERIAKTEEDLDALDNFLKDFENTGKSIVTYYDTNKVTGAKSGAWEVEIIDNKIKDGALNLDSAAANNETLFALGVDPSLIGAGMPGKELGTKSGSDKRESHNLAVVNASIDRTMTLDTLNFIRDFNGWNSNIKFAYEDTILTTLDLNPTGVQEVNV